MSRIATAALEAFHAAGWIGFGADPRIAAWAAHAQHAARMALRDPAHAHWLRCGGSWFVGVDALPNDARGRIAGGPPLAGEVIDFIAVLPGCGALPLHRAQLSACYPGYPRQGTEESAAGWRFRLEHDAAHLDGLLATGAGKRRYLREPHAYVLGLPLLSFGPDAAAPVVWEGSHRLMHAVFASLLAAHSPERWDTIDLTDAYKQARAEVFARCPRVVLDARPGEAFVLHRHLLHGIAPWADEASAGPDPRMIAYFRPQLPSREAWLSAS